MSDLLQLSIHVSWCPSCISTFEKTAEVCRHYLPTHLYLQLPTFYISFIVCGLGLVKLSSLWQVK